jgi:hypothetical protein
MAWHVEGSQVKIPGLRAGADLSAPSNQHKFVKYSALKTVIVCTAATDRPCGVLQNTPTAGDAAEVVCFGITKVQGDADLGFGDLIGTSADGQADAKLPGTDITEYVCGHVIEDNTTAGALATAFVNCVSPHRGA